LRKISLFLSLLMSLAIAAPSQEVFELLRKGDLPAVKALIEKSPELLDARDRNGDTLLHYAAQGGNAELIRYLIDKGAKLDLAGARKQTPLHIGAAYDRGEAVAALIERKAALDARDDYGRTPLLICARELGQAATGRKLIEAGADVNAEDRFGSTALELAAWRGKRDFIELLLEKGSRIPEPGEKWYIMLQTAASEGLEKLFRPLAGQVRDLKASGGEGLLQAAAAGGSAEIVNLLLEKGYSPVDADRFGWTPLHYAARDGRADAARILIERGAPLNARTIMGQSAYNIAQERKYEAAASLLSGKGADSSPIAFPELRGDYLGQKPPVGKAELFGLGIISSVWGIHSTAVFSLDGNEVYWAPMISRPGGVYSEGGLLMMKRVDGRWTAPGWAPFSGPGTNDDVPFFAAGGKRIYFISTRPLPGETEPGSEKIWFADRTSSGWAEPRPLDRIVNEHHMHWNFSVDKDRNVYFAGNAPDSLGMADIYIARYVDGKYEKPVNAGAPINSAANDEMPFIARDGSYLLFARQFDIWISFRGEGGAWLEPAKLGPEVNGPAIDICPVVTADGKYLFFLSQRDGESHAYWVGADVLDKYKPRPVNALILLGEWFGDAYFPLKAEIESRGWTMKRVGLDGEYRGCYNKKRDVALRSEILIQDKMDLSGFDCLIIPSGPQFRKFRENPAVFKFVKDAYAAGLLIASFCVGNNTVRDAGLIDIPYGPGLFPDKVTLVKERILLGPRGGGPPPGDGFESAPIKEICDALARELSAKTTPVLLTYVANMGVLVGSGETKVLIDALFDKPNPEYRAPGPDTLDRMMKGAAPFDGVDLVLVTHNHPDHFNASVAVRYLESLPGPVFLAPADAVAEMRKVAVDWPMIKPRVISLDLKVGENEKRVLAQIPLTIIRTLHSGNRDTPMNLMYLFDLDGRRIFHEGDSTGKPEVFQGFGLETAPVDLAVVHFWFPLDPNISKFLQEIFTPDHIALTHLPIHLEDDAPGKIDMVRQSYKDIFLLLPGMPAKAFR